MTQPFHAPRFAFIAALGLALALALASPSLAQFTGPGPEAGLASVAQVSDKRLGSYVTLEGTISNRLREDYYTFTDDSGEIRIEIEPETFRGQQIDPTTRIRIMGEVDTGFAGRYIWVSALSVL